MRAAAADDAAQPRGSVANNATQPSRPAANGCSTAAAPVANGAASHPAASAAPGPAAAQQGTQNGKSGLSAAPSVQRSSSSSLSNGAADQRPQAHALGQHSGTQRSQRHPAASGLRQQARCFGEMLRKRALMASRDLRGAVFTLLLPILAVAAVLVRSSRLLLYSSPHVAMALQRSESFSTSHLLLTEATDTFARCLVAEYPESEHRSDSTEAGPHPAAVWWVPSSIPCISFTSVNH